MARTSCSSVSITTDQLLQRDGVERQRQPLGTIDLSNPSYGLRYTPQLPVNSYTDDRFTTFAGYIQDQATYGALHLTGGLRLTSLNFVENSNIGVANDKTYTHLSPRIGATLDVVKSVTLFAGYATTFRAPFGFIGTVAPKPETSSNIEGGVKLALAGSGLSGTIAAVRQTHDNVVTADPTNVGFYVQNGRQRARGIEDSLTGPLLRYRPPCHRHLLAMTDEF